MTDEDKVTQQAEGRNEPQCILCGRCLEVCPLVAATGREELGPRGKMLLLLRLREAPQTLCEDDAARLASMCLSCGRCAKVCPQKVNVPLAVARVRQAHPGFARWLWKAWIGSSRLSWPAAARLGRAAVRLAPAGSESRAARTLRSLSAMAAEETVTPWIVPDVAPACAPGEKTVLFPGCLASNVRRRYVRAATALLSWCGAEVESMPDFGCCGGTLGHAGLGVEQAKARARNVAAWRAAGRPRMVTFCASCHAGLAEYAADATLFADAAEAAAFAAALVPLSVLVADGGFRVEDGGPAAVVYHRPCHAPQDDPDARLLRKALGGRLRIPDRARCCGMGGVLQLSAPELSAQVADACWDGLDAVEGTVVLTGCSGCVLQLAASAPRGVRVAHWLDALHFEE
ncbi:glycolate oxidase iron-sulfur subunit [Desulfobaculum xiamenense]|uniref:Glycolate oxidase iron-sulfur subunit n=1 Tax=Desulfobaculum xiamenense TaxID=995050 RepID=A0A846QN52_9BACT|nr:(Fe-S)-binding protein [Desulfobaculum xiamenense]NJB68617.1 glycolate oxidase iron-sulfur subunit [Desulfobaculum xiamenense]